MSDCPLCQRLARTDDDARIADLALGTVILGDNQGCPGWCVLILRRHAEHLDDLPVPEQSALFAEVAAVAAAIRRVFPAQGRDAGPVRINYECLGNQVGHIHWHIIPRHASDPDPRSAVWGWPPEQLRGTLDPAARRALAASIRRELAVPAAASHAHTRTGP